MRVFGIVPVYARANQSEYAKWGLGLSSAFLARHWYELFVLSIAQMLLLG